MIFALEGTSTWYQEVPRVIGYAGSIVALFNIILTNLIILSKSVSRECRALMFGITCAFGALGAILGLTLGQLLHDCLNHDSLFIAEILFCIAFIVIYYCLGG